jgi:hypothetical protein
MRLDVSYRGRLLFDRRTLAELVLGMIRNNQKWLDKVAKGVCYSF